MRKLFPAIITALAVVCMAAAVGAFADEPDRPVVEIVAPPNGAAISGSQVEIVVEFNSTPQQPVSKVEVYLDGQYVTERLYETPPAHGSCAFRWDTSRTPNGHRKLDVQAFSGTDYLGMASCTVIVSNRVPDLTPPEIAIVSPGEGDVVSGVIQVVIETSDNSGREPFVSIYIDNSLKSVKNHGPFVYEWDTEEVENGPRVIEATAVDDSGNQSDAKPVRVIVRNPIRMAPLTAQPAETTAVPEIAVEPVRKASAQVEPSGPSATPREADLQSRRTSREHARALASETASTADTFEAGRTPLPGVKTPSTATPSIPNAAAPRPAAEAPSVKEEPRPAAERIPPAEAAPAKALDLPVPASPQRPGVPKPAARQFGAETPRASVKADVVYTVQPGDSVCKLAREFGVPVQLIAQSNNLKDPSLIKVGEKLRIPVQVKMVALRPYFDKANGTVVWDQEAKTVRAVCPQAYVELTIGSAEAIVNCEQVIMEKPAAIDSGRTMVAESFVTQTLGMTPDGN